MAEKGSSKNQTKLLPRIMCRRCRAPFPFGSTSHSAIAFGGGVLALACFRFAARSDKGSLCGASRHRCDRWAYGFVLHEQLSETPWIATPHPIWAKASAVLGVPIKPLVTLFEMKPFYALGARLPAFWLCCAVCSWDGP